MKNLNYKRINEIVPKSFTIKENDVITFKLHNIDIIACMAFIHDFSQIIWFKIEDYLYTYKNNILRRTKLTERWIDCWKAILKRTKFINSCGNSRFVDRNIIRYKMSDDENTIFINGTPFEFSIENEELLIDLYGKCE